MYFQHPTGSIDYARCFGARTVLHDESQMLPPMEADTPMRLASATKLLTTIMALQCVEQGLVDLDENLSRLLPELSNKQVLTGFNNTGAPILRTREGIITLR